ncbi:MAG: glycosyltransferase [bacterium]|nr:glycosyltransferase [bacterium]
MKVLYIGKYPPIEGGVSAGNYWLIRALGKRGIQVSVVTNAFVVEDMYREELDLPHDHTHGAISDFQPANVHVHSLEKQAPSHIPYSPAYLSRIINLGLKVLGEHGGDVIYTHYLEPYSAAGFVIKKITGLPLIVRHAGSDIYRILDNPDFKYFLGRVLQEADRVLLSKSLSPLAQALNIPEKNICTVWRRVIDDSMFTPEGERFDFSKKNITVPDGVPIFTYIGKANTNKGIIETIEALSGIKKDFRLLFVSKGKKLEEFKEKVAQHQLEEKVIFLDFVPPWVIPSILRASSALLHLENNFPIPIHSPGQPYEAIATQTPLIVSSEIHNKLKHSFPSTAPYFNVVKNVSDIDELRSIFLRVCDSPDEFQEHAQEIREEFLSTNNWDAYIDSYVELYRSLTKG